MVLCMPQVVVDFADDMSRMNESEALGQSQEFSWQVWLRLVAIGFALMSLSYLVSVGAIRFGGGNVDDEDQNGGPDPAVNEVPVQDDADEDIGETERDKNDSISGCSDPD